MLPRAAGPRLPLCLLLLLPFLIPPANADEKLFHHPHNSGRRESASDLVAAVLRPGVDAHDVAAAHGFAVHSSHDTVPNAFLFEPLPHLDRAALRANASYWDAMGGHEHVVWAERQVHRSRTKRGALSGPELHPHRLHRRDVVSDPLYPQQWHLHGDSPMSLDVEAVWSAGYQGRGVTVCIVDDGISPIHKDLYENFSREGSRDVNFNDDDPTPDEWDNHGTESGGVAAANANHVCGVGVAYRAGLSAVRLLASDPTDAMEATALGWAPHVNDIYSCSWGPTDDGHLEGPKRLALAAIEQGVRTGRGGRGAVYVWAGGNGASSQDMCNYDGYVNLRYTIAIGAVTFSGREAWYSEACTALHAVVPSSGDSGHSIITADTRQLPSGDPCSTTFGGTSAAAPMAAGLLALVLEMNPELTWRDVQAVVVKSAQPVDTADAAWFENAAGIKYSTKYGFGALNARAMMEVALTHRMLPEELSHSTQSASSSASASASSFIDVADLDDFVITHTDVFVATQGYEVGSLAIDLAHDGFPTWPLMRPHRNEARMQHLSWRFLSLAHWGESPNGRWSLNVRVDGGVGRVSITSWHLTFHGYSRKAYNEG